jgi:protein involved in polysaccharide export with SLBB domain
MDYRRRAEASVKLEKEIASKLRQIIQNPSVSITITEYRSRPVSVLGEINKAGVLWLHVQTTLLETLSLAEGLKQDAGYKG